MRKHPRKRSSLRAGCRERERTETGPDNPLVRDCFVVVPWRESDCAQRQMDRLNRMMIGWANYFCLGSVSKAYRRRGCGIGSIATPLNRKGTIEWHPGHLDLRPSNPQAFSRHPIRHP
jgi:hypothetical protein